MMAQSCYSHRHVDRQKTHFNTLSMASSPRSSSLYAILLSAAPLKLWFRHYPKHSRRLRRSSCWTGALRCRSSISLIRRSGSHCRSARRDRIVVDRNEYLPFLDHFSYLRVFKFSAPSRAQILIMRHWQTFRKAISSSICVTGLARYSLSASVGRSARAQTMTPLFLPLF